MMEKTKSILFQCNPHEEVLGAKGGVGVVGMDGIDWGKKAGKGKSSWEINNPNQGESLGGWYNAVITYPPSG